LLLSYQSFLENKGFIMNIQQIRELPAKDLPKHLPAWIKSHIRACNTASLDRPIVFQSMADYGCALRDAASGNVSTRDYVKNFCEAAHLRLN
jgi:hypothetical protein